jgi:acetoin utilization protein AcuC
LIERGGADVVFSLAGGFHHARADRASGFCYVNDVVLACLQLAGSGRRVACLDVDAHHGDGIQEAFYGRGDVLTVSLHESGRTLYPWGGFEDERGEGAGLGCNVNIPLPAGTYDDAFLAAFDALVPPRLEAFAPDVLVLELGMDALAGDPLTHLALTNNAHVEVIHRLLRLGRPILVLGGGGYHVPNTIRGWALAWSTFAGEEDAYDPGLVAGGVLLGSTEWAGGLRDGVRPPGPEQQAAVEPEILRVIEAHRRARPGSIDFHPQLDKTL